MKPTRIFKTSATIIDHVNANNYLETDTKTGISKSVISGLILRADKHSVETSIKRWNTNSEALQEFKQCCH